MATVVRPGGICRQSTSPCPLCGTLVDQMERLPGYMVRTPFAGTYMIEGGDPMPSVTFEDTIESWPGGNLTTLSPCGHVFRGTELTVTVAGNHVELSCPDYLREAYDRTLKIEKGEN